MLTPITGLLLSAEAGTSFELAPLMTTAIEVVKDNIFEMLAIIIPSAVAIVGAVVAVKFGMKWLKKLGQG